MATTTVAAAGTALALYYYSQRGCNPEDAGYETHTNAHRAPKSFLEDLYFFAEGLRYTYGETIGRWRTADLLIGLAYLCRKETEEHPVADIARQGHVFALKSTGQERIGALDHLRVIERVFRYCSGLRERRPIFQRRYIKEILCIAENDILLQEIKAGVLKPSYILTRDHTLKSIVLAIRGTHSFKDAFTSLTGASKPHHMVDANGVVLGYSHFGMLAAARWMKNEIKDDLSAALDSSPHGYKLLIIGHSLGGGTAAMLTMMLREQGGIFSDTTCIAIACPACMTLELAQSCSAYVTTIINNTDVIPTISPGSADILRESVMQSSWSKDFRKDVRSSSLVRAVESSLRGVGSATASATSWTATRLNACYRMRPAPSLSLPVLLRRNSTGSAALTSAGTSTSTSSTTPAIDDDSGRKNGPPCVVPGASASLKSGDGTYILKRRISDGASGSNDTNDTGYKRNIIGGGGSSTVVKNRFSNNTTTTTTTTTNTNTNSSAVPVSLSPPTMLLPSMISSSSSSLPALPLLSSSSSLHANNNNNKNRTGSANENGQWMFPWTMMRAFSSTLEKWNIPISSSSSSSQQQQQQQSTALLHTRNTAEYQPTLDNSLRESSVVDIITSTTTTTTSPAYDPHPTNTHNNNNTNTNTIDDNDDDLDGDVLDNPELEEEVYLRMRQVKEAVDAAEEEERKASLQSSTDNNVVPSVIRPGNYGGHHNTSNTSGSSSNKNSVPSRSHTHTTHNDPVGATATTTTTMSGTTAWRRMMYPAGRIMHMVPARLVPGFEDESMMSISNDSDGDGRLHDNYASTNTTNTTTTTVPSGERHALWPEAKMEEDFDTDEFMMRNSAPLRDTNTNTSNNNNNNRKHTRNVSELSLKDLISSEEAAGSACVGGGTTHGPLPPLKPAPGPPPEPMLLLDYVPQEAYNRIKLCRTVLSDHVIPNYLRSLATFQKRLVDDS